MACGPQGDDKTWYCDGLACNKGAIHSTCKKTKEAEGYTFVYTKCARLMQGVHDKQRDSRLANMPQPLARTREVSPVQKAIAAAQQRLAEDAYFKK